MLPSLAGFYGTIQVCGSKNTWQALDILQEQMPGQPPHQAPPADHKTQCLNKSESEEW